MGGTLISKKLGTFRVHTNITVSNLHMYWFILKLVKKGRISLYRHFALRMVIGVMNLKKKLLIIFLVTRFYAKFHCKNKLFIYYFTVLA